MHERRDFQLHGAHRHLERGRRRDRLDAGHAGPGQRHPGLHDHECRVGVHDELPDPGPRRYQDTTGVGLGQRGGQHGHQRCALDRRSRQLRDRLFWNAQRRLPARQRRLHTERRLGQLRVPWLRPHRQLHDRELYSVGSRHQWRQRLHQSADVHNHRHRLGLGRRRRPGHDGPGVDRRPHLLGLARMVDDEGQHDAGPAHALRDERARDQLGRPTRGANRPDDRLHGDADDAPGRQHR